MILCSQAKLENDNKSINVKRGLRTRCEMGLWPAPAPVGYINEEMLIEQFVALMDRIDLDEIGIREKNKAEVERIKKFQRIILGTKEKIEVREIDIRNYAKYILKEATDPEKRELLGCLKSKIVLNHRQISLGVVCS